MSSSRDDIGSTRREMSGRETLGTALPKEMARVRELLPLYDAIPAGKFAYTMMRADLDGAVKAMADGNLAEMIVRYERLKGYSA